MSSADAAQIATKDTTKAEELLKGMLGVVWVSFYHGQYDIVSQAYIAFIRLITATDCSITSSDYRLIALTSQSQVSIVHVCQIAADLTNIALLKWLDAIIYLLRYRFLGPFPTLERSASVWDTHHLL